MSASRQWLYYTLIRLGLFTVALAVLLVLRVNPYLATIAAAIIGFCLSYLFLHKRRAALARSLNDIRTSARQPVQQDEDNNIENAALDRLDQDRAEHVGADQELDHNQHGSEP